MKSSWWWAKIVELHCHPLTIMCSDGSGYNIGDPGSSQQECNNIIFSYMHIF